MIIVLYKSYDIPMYVKDDICAYTCTGTL